MISTTPYLIRAIYDWCSDQGFTPHLLVDASAQGVEVPRHLVENDTIVLNIQASAVRGLEMGNEWIVFNARFSGQGMNLSIPVSAVRAIFARENGLGCAFEAQPDLTPEEAEQALQELNEQMAMDEQSEGSDQPPAKTAKSEKIATRGGKKSDKKGDKKPHLKLV